MKRKTSTLNKKGHKNKIGVIRSCKGSFDFVKKNKSKGLFYFIDEERGSIELVENITGYKEKSFSSIEELEKYIKEKYC